MKQRFELYINGKKADIGKDSPVLFNYTTEELRNPTIVKNSYSKQLTLDGTRANNDIFQCYFRGDATVGAGFDPSKRVPFKMYADGGRAIEAGYVKLNKVTRLGQRVTYDVTLYGGLGSFLYGLQYDAGGARTLAGLTYPDETYGEFKFVINANTIRNAWSALLNSDYSLDSWKKWRNINFAPCYNGIPDSDKFDASHALVKASDAGLQTSVTEDGKTYEAKNGYALVDLPEAMDEYQVKDIRSYLQRPVIRVRSIIEAICAAANNGGYTVELDEDFFNSDNPYYEKAWMTLKMLTAMKQEPEVVELYGQSGSIAAIVQDNPQNPVETRSHMTLEYPSVPSDATCEIAVTVTIQDAGIDPADANIGDSLYLTCTQDRSPYDPLSVAEGVIFQAVAYNANGVKIGGSKLVLFTGSDPYGEAPATCKEFCEAIGFVPNYDTGEGDGIYGETKTGYFTVQDLGSRTAAVWSGANATLEIKNVKGAATVRVFAIPVSFAKNIPGGGTPPFGALYKNRGIYEPNTVIAMSTITRNASGSFQYSTGSDIRTDATVTKAALLSDTMSPAEFLLSYCKRYGLMINADAFTKKVRIMTRGTFYAAAGNGYALPTLDIDGCINRAKAVEITPVPFDVQRFEFSEPDAGAAYTKEYNARIGRPYGVQRVNTGFEFNSDTKKLLDGTKFKTAPEVKMRDLAFLKVLDPYRPAVFLNPGMKYHLFGDDSRETNELDVPSVPGYATIVYYDALYKTYDFVSRVQLCGDNRKPIDGDGVLLFLQGEKANSTGAKLTDDTPEMYLGNREKPCWILGFNTSNADSALRVPAFGRHLYSDAARLIVSKTLDFGIPAEVDMPNVTFAAGASVYGQFWETYIRDRYSPRTKVVTAYVHTGGRVKAGSSSGIHAVLSVDDLALRRFYWFDGALWVLNKIMDYDLNGSGVCKCEFVQVQDIDNYITT